MNEMLKINYRELGFSIVDLLSEDEIIKIRREVDGLLAAKKPGTVSRKNKKKTSYSYQHFGDNFSEFANQLRHYYFHLMTNFGTQPLHHLLS